MKPVTGPDGDNPITDEQIRQLADEYALVGRTHDVTECYVALGPSDMFWEHQRPSPETVRATRVRLAAAWNARHGDNHE